ncbi:MAG: carboxy terminal-processing peptidase [Porticoccaceae bacterium]
MRQLAALTILVSTLFVTLVSSDTQELTVLSPESHHPKLFREILTELATSHYSNQTIDDQLSQNLLETYIDRLDSPKRFFLATDIQEFQQWQYKLDDLAKRGDVSAAFFIFNRLRERAVDQLSRNIAFLENKNKQFDFTLNETILIDSDQRSWFSDTVKADDFWRKSMKDSIIRLLISGKDPEEANKLLIKRYQALLNRYIQRNSKDVFEQYANAFASLYDPHSSYFTPRSSENFHINMSLSLEGIGAQLTTEDEFTEVVDVISGGPADIQGILKPKDKIIGVGQGDDDIVDVIGWRIDDVVDLIRGEKGSTVRLQIDSGGNSDKIISIVRDTVKLEEKSAQSSIINITNKGINYKLGVIEIPTFYMDFEAYRKRDPNYKSTSRDVRKLLKDLMSQSVDGVVLDLRNNGGGSLYEATALTDLFIDYGPVVQIRDANQKIYRNQRATSKAYYDGPMVVLINRLSASASEIFAGAIQDYGRGLIVGSQSYGKGTVQTMSELSSGLLKLTVSKFYRVSGGSTQHRGIIPDIAYPSAFNADEIGESHLDSALPWDKIHSVPHQYSNKISDLIEPLQSAHKQRAYSDVNFSSMTKQLALTQEWKEEKSINLNLEQRKLRDNNLDLSLLAIENKRRLSQKLEAFPNIEAWELAQENEDSDDTVSADSDPILFETGYILSDQISLLQSNAAKIKNNKIISHIDNKNQL